ncbi:MAG: substrate-binding domain-containing protein [Deltaproteobacteria bacterium]|nr:substrate-binding domain-containing protein [Deltaproteobacteria bacterium]
MTRALLIAIALAACETRAPIWIDGSSTLFPLAEAVTERLHGEAPAIEIVASASGSAAGIGRLCRGEVAIALSSRAMSDDERGQCRAHAIAPLELPIATDAIAIAVHPETTFVTALHVFELREIWRSSAEGSVTRWHDVRAEWPDTRLQLYGAGPFSGTFAQFALVATGRPRALRGDYIGSEDDSVLVRGVAGDRRALGFFGWSVFRRSAASLRLIAVDFGAGPVLPSVETLRDGRYALLTRKLMLYVDTQRLRTPEIARVVRRFVELAPGQVDAVGLTRLADSEYARTASALHDATLSVMQGGGATDVRSP